MGSLARSAVWAAGGVGLALAAWGVVETHLFRLRHAAVPVLPEGARPLKVLHVSDLHLHPGQGDKIAWVSALAELKPDLVVNTGDNLSHPKAVDPALEALSYFQGVPGVFVLGSNDYFAPRLPHPWTYLMDQGSDRPRRAPKVPLPWRELVNGMRSMGWHDLTNSRASLTVEGVRLDFVGVDDPHLGYDTYDAVSGPAAGGDVVTVGVTHAPYRRVLDAMAGDGVDLMMAGHTHGGQVCWPNGRAVVTNCDLPVSHAKGLHEWETPGATSWLHVTGGLGNSPFVPVRIACPPEATLLTLTPK